MRCNCQLNGHVKRAKREGEPSGPRTIGSALDLSQLRVSQKTQIESYVTPKEGPEKCGNVATDVP